MAKILEEVKDLYSIIEYDTFRKTPGVVFDVIPVELLAPIDSMDRVIHERAARSPAAVGDVSRPWYMHAHQEDNLVVLQGERHVDIYTSEHGKIENFTVTANEVYKNDELICEGSVMLVWPRGVFHRIVSAMNGSASINLASHYEGFDIKHNFNIYDVDTGTGKCTLLREGFLDQMGEGRQ
jgi:hypothetical protein